MYEREVDGRRKVAVTDIEALVPENHLVRKIEKVMDYEWIYERVAPYYSAAKNVRPGTDPGVRGECGVPMVSGLRAVGQAPAFCDGKLCVLPAVPGRTGSRNL